MQKLWYCKKCKRLYKTNPGIRCHNGDRIHETTMDMLSGYEENGYQFLEDKKKALLQEYSLDKIIQEFKMMEEPKKPEPKKQKIPAKNHPWRLSGFQKFVKQQKHHLNDDALEKTA